MVRSAAGRREAGRTDPEQADSDGDGALDGLEATRPTDPLEPDHLVTVRYLGLQAGKGSSAEDADGDAVSGSGSDPGEFFFNFRVRYPDPFSDDATVLRTVVGSWSPGPTLCPLQSNFCQRDFRGTTIVQINAPQLMSIPDEFDVSSFQFALPFTRAFVLEGVVQELDPFGDSGLDADHSFYFGGPGDQQATFPGASLAKGTTFHAFTYTADPVRIDVTAQVTVQ